MSRPGSDRRRRARHRAAYRAGFVAFLAFALTSSLFAAPSIATQLDFAHTHSEETGPHVHDLSAVLVPAEAAPLAPFPYVPAAVAGRALLAPLPVLAVTVDPANPVRGPPVSC